MELKNVTYKAGINGKLWPEAQAYFWGVLLGSGNPASESDPKVSRHVIATQALTVIPSLIEAFGPDSILTIEEQEEFDGGNYRVKTIRIRASDLPEAVNLVKSATEIAARYKTLASRETVKSWSSEKRGRPAKSQTIAFDMPA